MSDKLDSLGIRILYIFAQILVQFPEMRDFPLIVNNRALISANIFLYRLYFQSRLENLRLITEMDERSCAICSS